MSEYCDFARGHPLHGPYHDTEYGFPSRDEAVLFERLLAVEYDKLQRASNRDVHDNSKQSTLPIAREIVETYVLEPVKLPWYIDLLNINLDNFELNEARRRIRLLADTFRTEGRRVTENLDFDRGAVQRT